MAEKLLDLSVWADLREGTNQLSLLSSIGRRVGLTSVLIATDGPLSATTDEAKIVAAESISSVPLHRRPWTSSEPPAGSVHLPTWPERELFRAVAVGSFTSVDVAVSVGRTDAEAKAKAAADPLFESVAGAFDNALVGRLEDVQQQVARLAAAGIRELCCILPAGDLVDHLAQLSSIAVGALDTHFPGSPRSADPLPPAGWGGPSRVVSA